MKRRGEDVSEINTQKESSKKMKREEKLNKYIRTKFGHAFQKN